MITKMIEKISKASLRASAKGVSEAISEIASSSRKGGTPRNDKCRVACIALAMVMILAAVGIAAEEEAKETIKPTEITGEVSVIGRNYISIVYARDEKKGEEYEIMLPFTQDVKFIRKRLDELVVGDKVRVKCDDYLRKNEEGKEICGRRVPKEIQFLSPPIEDKLVGKER